MTKYVNSSHLQSVGHSKSLRYMYYSALLIVYIKAVVTSTRRTSALLDQLFEMYTFLEDLICSGR